MVKKPVTVEIPESLTTTLDELAKKTGRKKNLLIAASLREFLTAAEEDQEKIIRKYLKDFLK